ncbi:ABC transporter permease [Ruicaihuangia caeni]|uniref:ABC transporter permease n=1 Tax=Ruicaihuangia caeni TaxID=3042517 RepID=A0AAW6T8C5_9MICO|nr:ABC transporter permease [Klugiella sp. YN-L-19]MDI2097382.1 ABC transporter permease [Klugiella sp. YN-L-19]
MTTTAPADVPTASAPLPGDEHRRPAIGPKLAAFTFKYGLVLVLVLMIVFFAVTQPAFRTVDNFLFILQASAVVAIVGLGATVSMTVGGFDLSVGATVSLSVMVAATTMVKFAMTGTTAILFALLAGVGVGLLNAFLIVIARIPDLVATLAAMFLVNGVTLWWVNGQSVAVGMTIDGKPAPGVFTEVFEWLGSGRFLGIPASVIVSAVVFGLVVVLLNFTRWGRALYAVGGNPVAAEAVGIRVRRYRVLAYVISGLLASIGGVLLVARLGRGDVAVGDAYLLQAISAALVGYAVLGANKPNAVGTLVGAVFVATLINGLTMFNFPYYAQSFVQGALLVVALLMSYTLGPRRRR